jgi:hypothetical protein
MPKCLRHMARLCFRGERRAQDIRRVQDLGAAEQMRRLADLVIACASLAITLPLMIIVALMIRFESPGPVFGQHDSVLAQMAEQVGGDRTVASLTWRQDQFERQSARIGQGVDLGRQPAARAAHGFFRVGRMLMDAHRSAVDHLHIAVVALAYRVSGSWRSPMSESAGTNALTCCAGRTLANTSAAPASLAPGGLTFTLHPCVKLHHSRRSAC